MSWLVSLLLPLAVGAQSLPAVLAGAGGIGWTAPLLAAWPAAWLMMWLGRWRSQNPNECPSQMALRCWGGIGWGIQAAWALWALVLASYVMRSLSERLIVTVFPVRNPWPHVAVGLLLCGLMAKRNYAGRGARSAPYVNDAALYRATKMFAAGALGLCGLVLCFVTPGLQWRYLVPETGDWASYPGVLPAALSVCSLTVFSFFLLGPSQNGKDRRPRWWQMVCVGPLLAIMAAVTVGTFGPALTSAMPFGFFWAIKNAAIPGGMRIEAIFVMIWLTVDLTVISLLMRAAMLFTKRSGWGSSAAAAALVAAGTAALGYAEPGLIDAVILWGSAGLFLGLPGLLLITGRKGV
jgi:hypothetical protein